MNKIDRAQDEKPLHCIFCLGKNALCNISVNLDNNLCQPSAVLISDIQMNLPESILLHIFCFLNQSDLLRTRNVSKQWKRITEDGQLWRYLNLSCKRISDNHFIFKLPKAISKLVKTVNLMWAHQSISSFNRMKILFINMEILLMQHSTFSLSLQQNDFSISMPQSLPLALKILDLRNVHGRWFDETKTGSTWPNIEAMAFSKTMPLDWMSRLSMNWLPKLRILCIENNPGLTDSFLSGIIHNSPSLQSISLHGCMYIQGIFLQTAITHLKKLETLDLSGTRLESSSITTIDWQKFKMITLNISFCCKIYESDLIYLLPQLKHLQQLRASFTGWGRALSDMTIYKMAVTDLILDTIDIQSTFNLSVNALAVLCSHSPLLKHLRIGTILKTSRELTTLLKKIPHIQSLSFQLGEANFSAALLFNSLAASCKELETLFTYNVTFDTCPVNVLYDSFVMLFTSCKKLRNFFTGGYAYHVKKKIDGTIKSVTKSLNIKMNTEKPTRIIPLPKISFDRYMCDVLTQSKVSLSLRETIQHAMNCQSFYKTGLLKLDEYHFSLLRA